MRHAILALMLCLLPACSVMDVTLPDSGSDESKLQNETGEPEILLPRTSHSHEEVKAWVLAEIGASYRLAFDADYSTSIETLDSRREVFLAQDVPLLLSKLWAEYPSEEIQELATQLMYRYYQAVSCEVLFTELEVSTGDYLVTLVLSPLKLPAHMDSAYIQGLFNEITQEVSLSDLSLEEYMALDNQVSRILLEELLAQEVFPTDDEDHLTIRLQRTSSSYLFPKSEWQRLHQLLLNL